MTQLVSISFATVTLSSHNSLLQGLEVKTAFHNSVFENLSDRQKDAD